MSETQCVSCGGTGWWLLNRSAFLADGFRRVRCHLCNGSGTSRYRDDAAFVREQCRRRALEPKP